MVGPALLEAPHARIQLVALFVRSAVGAEIDDLLATLKTVRTGKGDRVLDDIHVARVELDQRRLIQLVIRCAVNGKPAGIETERERFRQPDCVLVHQLDAVGFAIRQSADVRRLGLARRGLGQTVGIKHLLTVREPVAGDPDRVRLVIDVARLVCVERVPRTSGRINGPVDPCLDVRLVEVERERGRDGSVHGDRGLRPGEVRDLTGGVDVDSRSPRGNM